jgi:hypothetical protein
MDPLRTWRKGSMRELLITVTPVNGGYQIVGEFTDDGSMVTSYTAICSTYSQIHTRIRSLVDVVKENMRFASEAS